jgi:bile acid:Na+ symporter, BASS family
MLRTLVAFLAAHLVFALMLAVGLQVRLGDVDDVRRRPALYLRSLAVIELAVPLLAIAVVAVFRPPPLAMGALLLMAVCPGVAMLTRAAPKKGGSLTTAVNMLLLLSLLAPLTVPAWLAVLARVYDRPLQLAPGQVFATVAPAVLLPLALGMVVHALLPRLAPKLSRAAMLFFNVALLVVAVLLVVKAGPALLQVGPRALLAMLVLITASALLGHWAGGPRLEDRRTVALAAVFGNPALAIAIIKVNFPDSPAVPLLGAYLLLRALALLPYHQWAKRRPQATARADHLPPGAVPH